MIHHSEATKPVETCSNLDNRWLTRLVICILWSQCRRLVWIQVALTFGENYKARNLEAVKKKFLTVKFEKEENVLALIITLRRPTVYFMLRTWPEFFQEMVDLWGGKKSPPKIIHVYSKALFFIFLSFLRNNVHRDFHESFWKFVHNYSYSWIRQRGILSLKYTKIFFFFEWRATL